MSDIEAEKPKELPYGAEYAKTSRASCKGCKEPIVKDSLKMAIRFQSNFFDGYQENWHHFECFWKKAKKNDMNEESIKGMEWLKWEDQESIRQRMNDLKNMPDNYNVPKSQVPKIDQAKTSAGKCFKCKEKILKEEFRIAFKASYYHLKCFKEANLFTGTAESISGFETLDEKNKTQFKEFFPNANTEKNKRKIDEADKNTSKKAKTDVDNNSNIQQKLKHQSELLWQAREEFSQLRKSEIESILLKYGQIEKESLDKKISRLVDYAVFGVPEPCPECKKGVIHFSDSIHSYRCTRIINETTRCSYTNKNPKRFPLKFKTEKNDFLKKYKNPLLCERIYPFSTEIKSANNSFDEEEKLEENNNTKNIKVIKNESKENLKIEDASNADVYADPVTKIPWQATLSAIDVESGHDIVFKIQMLKNKDKDLFYLVCLSGQNDNLKKLKTENCSDYLVAKNKFEKLFFEKTRNEWKNLKNFKKHPFGMNLKLTE